MKVGFVHIPKTGGGSVKDWWEKSVRSRHQMVTIAHQDLSTLLSSTGEQIDTSFTVVRNTWARLISMYLYSGSKLQKKRAKRPDDDHVAKHWEYHQKGIIPFIEWLQSIDHHNVRCQVRYSQGVEHVIVDHNREHWQSFCQTLGVDTMPGKTHRIQTYDVDLYLSPMFIDWVQTKYKKEIDYFKFTVDGIMQ